MGTGRLNLSIEKRTDLPYGRAVERAREVLQAEGFGVLTEIDVQGTLKEKMDTEFRRYIILGACNPPLAHRALEADLHVGLLLPCNVIVYEDAGGSVVAAVNPDAMIHLVDNDEMRAVAAEAKARLNRALKAL